MRRVRFGAAIARAAHRVVATPRHAVPRANASAATADADVAARRTPGIRSGRSLDFVPAARYAKRARSAGVLVTVRLCVRWCRPGRLNLLQRRQELRLLAASSHPPLPFPGHLARLFLAWNAWGMPAAAHVASASPALRSGRLAQRSSATPSLADLDRMTGSARATRPSRRPAPSAPGLGGIDSARLRLRSPAG